MDPNEAIERAVLVRLFQRFPHSFVWIGGSVLQLIHRSSRASHDLDLSPSGEIPAVAEVAATITGALTECQELGGLALTLADTATGPGFVRFTIKGAAADGFTVDIVKMRGPLFKGTHTELLSSPLGSATVLIPNDSTLLAQKLLTFLVRTYPKPGDLFDIWFLRDRGVKLSSKERATLADSLAFAKVDREEALGRLKRFSGTTWLRALARSGVQGLTPEAAKKLVRAAETLIKEVLP